VLDLQEIEKGFRAAALKDGDTAFRQFLSSIHVDRPKCPQCEAHLLYVDLRNKTIVSLMGTGEFEREYYKCPNGHGYFFPCDDIIGVHSTAFTPGVRLAVSRLAVSGSFEWASDTLAEIAEIYVSAKECQRISESAGEEIAVKNNSRINAAMRLEPPRSQISERADTVNNNSTMYIEYDGTGIPMTNNELTGRIGKQSDGSAKTREAKVGCIFTQSNFDDNGDPVRDKKSTSYVGAIEPASSFGWRIYTEALRRRIETFYRTVVIGDGAKWVWGLAESHFPNAIHIVDMYHAIEHLCGLAREFFKDPIEHDRNLNDWVAQLKAGRIRVLAKKILSVPNLNESQKSKASTEANYFKENIKRMRYAKFRKMGLFVGSGVVEATCKSVIGSRLKQSGMFWSLRGANDIISLRCSDQSCNEVFAAHFAPPKTNYTTLAI
jgi:hypothetical protein